THRTLCISRYCTRFSTESIEMSLDIKSIYYYFSSYVFPVKSCTLGQRAMRPAVSTSSPATASAEGSQFNGATFPTSATAAGAQFNVPPSPSSPMAARTRSLLEAPIVPTLLRLAAPNIAVMAVQAIVSTCEVYFIGWLGSEALAGVALVYPLIML